ncbi:hypothetical protein [Burkholderia gladioli]|uniref:hypothetical protein n=1 Tax=Burkholderia gladioli TaxID=28095 RepID=UPI00163E90A2|nr:hypothetical protein [Burkholderia gladioli]
MAISFKQTKDINGQVRQDMIIYTDESGQVWYVPIGHRIWREIYEPWLAAGNTPAAA